MFGLRVEGDSLVKLVGMAQVEVLFLGKFCFSPRVATKIFRHITARCIHSGRAEPKKSALGGMWRERRSLGLCCIVIEASQVLQTGPVTELVLVLGGERGKTRQEEMMVGKLPDEFRGGNATVEGSLLSERWLASGYGAS